MFRMDWVVTLSVATLLGACGTPSESNSSSDAQALDAGRADAGWESQVTVLETFDVSEFNVDLVDDIPTAEIAFYITDSGPLAWSDLRSNITRAQRIFLAAGVQLRIRSALLLAVPAAWQSLDADEVSLPMTPAFLETDLYAHLDELATRLAPRNEAIFEAIVAHLPDSESSVPAANLIHVVTLNEAPIAYYDWTGTEWLYQTAPTGGLSFPPYAYADRIPEQLRGVITLSFRQDTFRPESRVLAHEIGHKMINVSHEGVGVCPAFAANGPELMLYGSGELIPEGLEGRWHRERLLRSPFLYRIVDGTAVFTDVYQDGGIYRDGLYGELVVEPVCDEGTQP